ncbi:hypothetical protein ACFWE7_08785, partial [Isoptericola sp. NPDC060282]|uniref:hypothetical protein n=1 Tax=Isoptericola sp. NPDC060282 TaxID=3347093 RepID=UPI003649440B
MRVPQKSVALASAGLVALALSACGSEDPAASTSGASEAAQETAEIVTAANLTDLAEQMQGAQETASTSHLEMTYGGELADTAGMSGTTTTADISYGTTVEDTAMQMSMGVMGMDMDIVLLDGTIYMSMGELTQGKYLSLTAEEMAADPNMAGTFDSMESMDAAAQAEAMADAVTSFEHTGTEKVDGVDADVYTMTVDPSKLEDGPTGVNAEMADQVGEMTLVYKVAPEGLPVAADITMDIGGQRVELLGEDQVALVAAGEVVDEADHGGAGLVGGGRGAQAFLEDRDDGRGEAGERLAEQF